ncbi:unnamed protein product [Amoebophrya sp. A120]|nr:unnamed protein product [Amoebophrya sp. A120]|eukprot:GSA120T00007126001.1
MPPDNDPHQPYVEDDDLNTDEIQAARVLHAVSSSEGKLKLVKDNFVADTEIEIENSGCNASTSSSNPWRPLVEDVARRSYSYVCRFVQQGKQDKSLDDSTPSTTSSSFTKSELDSWFRQLHPDTLGVNTTGAWTDAYYKGSLLLRKTAWCVFDESCECEYGYSDTWQKQITNAKMKDCLWEITARVKEICGLVNSRALQDGTNHDEKHAEDELINCVNLNYYPTGGGVGFHADDEFLFDGLNRDTCIISLSLCSAGDSPPSNDQKSEEQPVRVADDQRQDQEEVAHKSGARKFQVRLKKAFMKKDDPHGIGTTGKNAGQGSGGLPSAANSSGNPEIHEVILNHGDLMTMEGLFQLYYLHSVWPGDDRNYKEHPLTQGERINLTWRTIVKHLDGSEECRGMKCPLVEG